MEDVSYNIVVAIAIAIAAVCSINKQANPRVSNSRTKTSHPT